MRKYLTYFACGIFALAFVFASVAVPVALSNAHDKDILNQVTVVQASETDQKYLSQAVSFSEQVESFSNAELSTKIARGAYPSELSMEEVIEKTRILLQDWLEELDSEMHAQSVVSVSGTDAAARATADAVLYESPSGPAKIPYWQITFQWTPSDILEETEWPITYVTMYCNTATGCPYCLDYYYYPFVSFSNACGIAAFANALGLKDQLKTGREYETNTDHSDHTSYEGAIDGSAAIFAAKVNTCFPLENEEYCVVKSMFIAGDGHECMQLIPNYQIK